MTTSTKYKFRLLRGTHFDDRKYERGQIIETDKDLRKLGTNKFQLLYEEDEQPEEEPQVDYEEQELLTMKISDLVAIAQEEEVDPSKVVRNKPKLVAAILENRAGRADG